jgi:hypothetical protein
MPLRRSMSDGARDCIAFGKRSRVGLTVEGTVAVELELIEHVIGRRLAVRRFELGVAAVGRHGDVFCIAAFVAITRRRAESRRIDEQDFAETPLSDRATHDLSGVPERLSGDCKTMAPGCFPQICTHQRNNRAVLTEFAPSEGSTRLTRNRMGSSNPKSVAVMMAVRGA